MTYSIADRKWFYRTALLLLTWLLAYGVLQPQYNFAHWIPHQTLRNIGVSYQNLLWFEQNADVILHFIGAGLLTYLTFMSQFCFFRRHSVWLLLSLLLAQILVEVMQLIIGRGFDFGDLLFGTLGCFVAYFSVIHMSGYKLTATDHK